MHAALTLMLAAGFGQTASACDRYSGRTEFTVEGKAAFVLKPCVSTIRGWVWYAPTRGRDLPDDLDDLLITRLRNAGLAVAGVDVGDFYGSPAGLQVFNSFYQKMTTEHGFDPKPTLLGRSRGGLEVMGWARSNADKVRGFAGVYPVLNLASFPGLEQASVQYGVTPTELQAMLPTVNPIETYAPLVAQRVPVYIIHGDSDAVVPFSQNGAIYQQRYAAAGGTITVKVAPGEGHSAWPGFWNGDEIFNFITARY